MATEVAFTVEDTPEGGCLAKALGHAIFVQGSELQTEVRDAGTCHFDPKAMTIRLHGVRDEVLAT